MANEQQRQDAKDRRNVIMSIIACEKRSRQVTLSYIDHTLSTGRSTPGRKYSVTPQQVLNDLSVLVKDGLLAKDEFRDYDYASGRFTTERLWAVAPDTSDSPSNPAEVDAPLGTVVTTLKR